MCVIIFYEVNDVTGDLIIQENDITVRKINNCFEDTSLFLKWKKRTHTTGENCFLLMGLSGTTIYTVNGKEYVIEKNDIAFFPENTIYQGACREVPARTAIIVFEGENISGFDEPFMFSPKKWESYESYFFNMLEKYIIADFGYKTELKAILYTLINKITKERMLSGESERNYRKIKNSILYIHENYTDVEMSIAKAADASGLSEVHFRRLFKEVFKISPLNYVTQIRIKKAKELLIHTEYQVGEIAGMVGIFDEVYFSKFFKKHTGKTPNEYRKEEF